MAKTDPKLALAELIQVANGRRHNFLMTLDQALDAAREALESPHGIAVRHGGGGRHVMGRTTLCLAVADKGRVVVGVSTGWADNPSPGRVWKEVGPWQQDFARNVEKARAWAKTRAADRVALGEADLGASAKKTAPGGGAELLAAVLANPDDDAARLVYADFLSQSGDERGELIAVQCALGSAPKGKRTALLKREKELLKANAKKWSQHASQVALECRFVRGFVGTIKATANAFTHHGAKLFETDPVEELILSKPAAAGLDLLSEAEHLGRLRKLQFSSPYWAQKERDVAALGRPPGPRALCAPPPRRSEEIPRQAPRRARRARHVSVAWGNAWARSLRVAARRVWIFSARRAGSFAFASAS